MSCLAAQPIVHGLATELEHSATFLKVDIMTDAGRAQMRQWGLVAVPSIVVLDPSTAQPAYRATGMPDTAAIKAAVAAVTSDETEYGRKGCSQLLFCVSALNSRHSSLVTRHSGVLDVFAKVSRLLALAPFALHRRVPFTGLRVLARS